ncbi:MAG: hypothetical protein HPY53_10650 [Brevinematales bacterium]|nr:hypothetical protein [Brevinematales bacterium]
MINKPIAFILIFSFLIGTGCCSKPPVKVEAPALQTPIKKYDKSNYGSVVYMKQGGFFGIVNDKGEKFVPEKLPDMFRFDGLRVFFDYQVLAADPGAPQWGTPVRLTFIEIE